MPTESVVFRRHWGGYWDASGTLGWVGPHVRQPLDAVRIDDVLAGGGGRATDRRVGPEVGSPHRPVLADLAWPAAR